MDASAVPLTVDQLAEAGGISATYAHNIVRGHRQPSDAVAIRIWRSTGVKLGGIAYASDADIEALERVQALRFARAS